MAVSAFFFAVMAAGAKVIGSRIPGQEIVLVRGILNSAFMLLWLQRKGIPWRPHRPWLLVLRGALGHFALSAYFWSVAHQSLARAVLLQQVHPVFVALLAAWLLGEKPGPRFVPAFLLAAAGVALLVPLGAGPTEAGRLLALAVGLTGAILSAAAYVTVRDASRTEHQGTIVLFFPLTSVPLAAAGTLLEGPVLPGWGDWVWLLFVAATGQLGQVYLTRGLARVPAGRATLADPLTILFGALLGWAAFAEPLRAGVVVGGAAIVAAVLLAGQRRSPGGGGDGPLAAEGSGPTLGP